MLGSACTALAPLLGPVRITPGERLLSSDRADVLRARARGADGREHPVVLKAPTGVTDGNVREQAALHLLTEYEAPGVVRLLGTADEPLVLVLEDLGGGPTLADRLMGDDPVAAGAAVQAWARALADLQVRTSGLRRDFLTRMQALSPLGTPPADTSPEALAEAGTVLGRDLPLLGVIPSDDALQELLGLGDALDVSQPQALGALVPGDTCPSNALETDRGLVLVDFESAQYRHIAWEAAYLTVPWPSCWCSWALPDALAAQVLDLWRSAVAQVHPAVLTATFDDDLTRAGTGWAFISSAWFLGALLAGDPPPPDPSRRGLIPRRTALLQHRLQDVATSSGDVLPHLAELASRIHRELVARYGAQELPAAPAFR